MKLRLLPATVTVLTAAAFGCAGTPTTTPSQAPTGEGRVSSGVSGSDAVNTTIVGSYGGAKIGGGLGGTTTAAGGTQGTTATTAGQATTTGQAAGIATSAPAQQAQTGTTATAVSHDHVGSVQQLQAGQDFPQPHAVRLDGSASDAGASATPTPDPTPTATPTPPQSGNTITGTTVPAATPSPLPVPTFLSIRTFSRNAAFQVIDYNRVVVVDGTTLTITTDGGLNWTVYNNVGRQNLRCLSFTSETSGWVGGDNGVLLKIGIADGVLSYKIKDGGSSGAIDAIYFSAITPNVGYYADEDASKLRKTVDDGDVWGDAVATDAAPVHISTQSGFRPDTADGAFFLPFDPVRAPGQFSTIYQVQNGRFFAQLTADKAQSLGSLSQYAPLAVFRDNLSPAARWYSTADWKTFATFSADMLTPTTILRGALTGAWLVDGTTLLGETKDKQLALSTDLGHNWTEPVALAQPLTWIWPFNTTQMWGFDASTNTLYRAGTPTP